MRERVGAPLPEDGCTVAEFARLIGRAKGFVYRRIYLRRVRAWRVGAGPDGTGGSLVLSRSDAEKMVVCTGPEESGHERAVRELEARGLKC